MNSRALFLDRDGVVNLDHGYVYKLEDFQFVEGVFDLCRHAISKGYLIFVITNQAGIGRGLYSVADFDCLTNYMCKEFLNQGVLISKVYYSPFHPTHGLGQYKKDDESRKPRPGMILKAIDEFGINVNLSVLIGDNFTDIQTGQNAGVGINILYTVDSSLNYKPDLTCHYISDLREAKFFLQGGE
jgi:D-glycero-D-manno-heptose 1,7-bisphosphate phosphatase